MRNQEFEWATEKRHEHSNRGKGHSRHRRAKTFRRGRAIAFLERLKVKRATIKEQLEKPEFQPIQQVHIGELKAIDRMMNEFIQLFEIEESELTEIQNKTKGDLSDAAFTGKDSIHDDEKGTKKDETN